MYWGDKIAEQAAKKFAEKIQKGERIMIRDEKTASGRVHVGSLRGVAIHGIVSEILSEKGIPNAYYYEINDFDPMDGIPVYLERGKYLPYMGKPLCEIPSPDGSAPNFAEYYGREFEGVIRELGFTPEFYRSSTLYKEGKYNGAIKTALDNAQEIRDIYKEVSGSQKGPDWYPISVRCESCGNISTTKVLSWDGKEVEYACSDIEWAKGCGNRGKLEPVNGNAKLPWKVEWAAKFKVLGVDIEGAGKDHSTKGGARQVAEAISRRVFKHEPPLDIPYEFLLVGGKKMSSSKGEGSSSREMADLLEPELLRFLLARLPMKAIDFIPDGDTVPVLYDLYDKAAETYWKDQSDDAARQFYIANLPPERKNLEKTHHPRFSLVAYLVQMPHVDTVKEVEAVEGVTLTEKDIEVLQKRAGRAKFWLEKYAPEDFKFEIQKELPESAGSFSPEQKAALKSVLEYVQSVSKLDGQELHTKLHEIKTNSGLEPKAFFEAIYYSILGKASGPKAGWFLSVLDKEFLERRLEEASE